MKIKSTITILLLISSSLLPAQWTNCQPDNPLSFAALEITENLMTTKIKEIQQFYDESELYNVKVSVDACNQQMENELRTLQGNIAKCGLKHQEILSLKDVAGIQKQIEDLKKSKEASIQTLEDNLSKTRHSGIFLVILPEINLLDNKNVFIQNAQAVLAPYAISDLNGERIQRLTEVKDYENVKDVITSFKGGEVTPVSDLFTNADYKTKRFLYMAKIQVAPAKKENFVPKESLAPEGKATVINLITEPNYRLILQKYNVAEALIQEITQKISSLTPIIQSENADADRRQADILLQGEEEIRKITYDISEYTHRLSTRKEKLKATLETIPGAKYEPNDTENAVQSALIILKKEMDNLNLQWNGIKEREIQFKETQVSIEGDPAEALAKESLRLYDQIQQNYTTFKRSMEFIAVENFEVTNFQTSDELVLYRQVNRIWTYLIPQSNGSFRLFVLANFKIKESNIPKPASIIINTPPPPRTISPPPTKPRPTYLENRIFDRDPKLIYVEDSIREANNRNSVMRSHDLYENKEVFENYKEPTLGGVEMIAIERGGFKMGSEEGNADETPIHTQFLGDFYLSKYEVTAKQWRKYCTETGKKMPPPPTAIGWHDDLPIADISWYEATDFCKWLSQKTGLSYRLPTEAEWEYAAKGGNFAKDKRYSGSNSPSEVAWYMENSMFQLHPVGIKKPNFLGLYDMSGNVYEWCADLYLSYEAPTNSGTETRRVIRGGSYGKSTAFVRIANRSSYDPARSNPEIGFRLARDAQ